MLAFAKFFHLIGLMLGAAAGFGSVVIAMRAKGEPASPLNTLRPVLGHMGLAGILLLWATGLWMYLGYYMGAGLGMAFGLKLAAATVVLALSLTLNYYGGRAAKTGVPPPAFTPKLKLRMTMTVLLLAAVALAVYVFN